MSKFIKLTGVLSGDPIYVSSEEIIAIHQANGSTLVRVKNDAFIIDVSETPDEVMNMLDKPCMAVDISGSMNRISENIEKHSAQIGMLNDRVKALTSAFNELNGLNAKLTKLVLEADEKLEDSVDECLTHNAKRIGEIEALKQQAERIEDFLDHMTNEWKSWKNS